MASRPRVGLAVLCGAIMFLAVAPAEITAAPFRTGAASEGLVQVQIVDDGRVAWLDPKCRIDCELDYDYEGRLSIVSARPDGSARSVPLSRRFGAALSERGIDNAFALSSRGLAFFTGSGYGAKYTSGGTGRIEVSKRGGATAVAFACFSETRPLFDLDRETVVLSDPCDKTRTRVYVSDLAGNRRVLYDEPSRFGPARELAIRDGYVALVTASPGLYEPPASNRLIVLDLGGREVMSFSAGPGRTVGGFALGDDGAIVLPGNELNSGPSACRSRLCWASPQRPSPRPIAVKRAPQSLRLNGDTVVYTDSDGDIHALRLGGRERKVVDTGRITPMGYPSFDADHRHVTYALQTCDGSAVIRTVRISASEGPEPGRCPLRFRGPREVRLKGRSIDVGLRCPRGCGGVLVTRRGRRLATEYGFQDFRQSRRRGRHRIELAPRIRRLVRSRGRVRVTVKAKVEQRAMADKRVVRRYTVTR